MKRRGVVLGVSLILTILLIAGGTFAWFTTSTEVEANEFTAGTLEIELHDEFNSECAQNVNPGDCFTKKVYVCNTGTKRAVVRIEADAAFSDDELSTDIVDWNLNPMWFEKNGYFVYKRVLAPGECTLPLFCFNKICFDGENMGNEYMGATFEVNIQGHAIQATHHAPEKNGWGVKVSWDFWPGDPVVPKMATNGEEGEVQDGPAPGELGDVIEIK